MKKDVLPNRAAEVCNHFAGVSRERGWGEEDRIAPAQGTWGVGNCSWTRAHPHGRHVFVVNFSLVLTLSMLFQKHGCSL